jgi:acyl carrier protein
MNAQFALEKTPVSRALLMARTRIEHWLMDYVARVSLQDVASVDVDHPFSYYDLDSIAAAEMTADIEDWLSVRLEPTLIWDYPSIARLASYLSELKALAR